MRVFKLASPYAITLAFAAALMAGNAKADMVIPDDVIIQGSLCVGFDCINNENFGSDTIILKEHQLRILFLDTSGGCCPTNDWRLIANDAAGAGNLFAIEDVTAGRRIMTLTAGAAANSIFVDNTGRVGLRTSTPVLDLHISTGNTPGQRLEQTNASGFTAQTWDIAGNEANFFVRDVTSGSKLPFRIRPGAPTSSLDISADGDIGMGTASPQKLLHISGNAKSTVRLQDTSAAANTGEFTVTADFVGLGANRDNTSGAVLNNAKTTASMFMFAGAANSFIIFGTTPNNNTGPNERMRIDKDGNVGIGTTTPSTRLHTTGGVRFQNVSGCGSGIQSDGAGVLSCLASSRQFKNVTGDLAFNVALANVMALRPQVGAYKTTPDIPEHWLIAEEVAAVDPALVGMHEGKPHVVKTQNVVADLVAVVQQQQKRIEELERRLLTKSDNR